MNQIAKDVTLWPYLWSALLAVAWLLPTGSAPWATYSSELWMGIVTLSGGVFVLLLAREPVPWHAPAIATAFLALVPWLQWSLGLMPYLGQAWTTSLYVFGFCAAMLVGTAWERYEPARLASLLFGAVLSASILSVGLQLYVFSGVNESGALGPLAAGLLRGRPSASLGQPNLLATLLLWGMLADLHFFTKKAIGWQVALVVAAFLLLGLALTQSRTGFLNAVLLWSWILFRRKLWHRPLMALVISGLMLYLLMCPYLLEIISDFLLLEPSDSLERLAQRENGRLQVWSILTHSAFEQPIWGYGWTETSSAQVAVADQFGGLGGIFSHSHNLFLDLILWMGFPLGLLAIFGLFWIFVSLMRNIQKPENAALPLCVLVVGVHAMLEFPLQYAYFLIPTGLMIGILIERKAKPIWVGNIWLVPVMLVGLALSLALTVKDYSRVEESYLLLRLEQGPMGENRPPLGRAPEVTVLTHLREWIVASRVKPQSKMTDQQLAQLELINRYYPSRSFAYNLATAYAMNNRPIDAYRWLSRLCNITDERGCALVKRSWERDAKEDSRLSAVGWPPI